MLPSPHRGLVGDAMSVSVFDKKDMSTPARPVNETRRNYPEFRCAEFSWHDSE
jgi:hypothetical protein